MGAQYNIKTGMADAGRLFGLSETNGIFAKVIHGVVLAQEDIT